MNLMILFFLCFAHCIGDMFLQTQFIGEHKGTKPFFMLCHLVIWIGCITIVLMYFKIYAYWKFAFLFIIHWLVDFWKSNTPKDKEHFHYIYYDQGVHFLQLLIVWWL